jgi:5'-3' exonuclease
MKKRIALVDFSGIYYANALPMCYDKIAEGKIDYNEIEPLLRHKLFKSLLLLTRKLNIALSDIVICCDGRGNWREMFNPYYKQGRKESKEESEINFNELARLQNNFLNDLKVLNFNVVKIAKMEGDDIVASIVAKNKYTNKYKEVVVVSNDKDLVQLLEYPNVHIYASRKDTVIYYDKQVTFNNEDRETIYEQLEMSPKRFLMRQILFGDKTDGVPNVKNPIDFYVNGEGRAKGLGDKEFEKEFPKSLDDNSIQKVLKNYNTKRIAQNTEMIDLKHIPDFYQRVAYRLFVANDEMIQEKPIKANELNSYFVKKGLSDLSNTLSAGFIRVNS